MIFLWNEVSWEVFFCVGVFFGGVVFGVIGDLEVVCVKWFCKVGSFEFLGDGVSDELDFCVEGEWWV